MLLCARLQTLPLPSPAFGATPADSPVSIELSSNPDLYTLGPESGLEPEAQTQQQVAQAGHPL